DIDANHLVAALREAGAADQSDVTRADDRDIHADQLPRGLEFFLDYVDRLVLGLVIGARQHLAQKPETHELHSDHQQQDSQQQRRARRELVAEDYFLEHQQAGPESAHDRQHHTDGAEDLDRTGRVAGQEPQGYQVKEGAKNTP